MSNPLIVTNTITIQAPAFRVWDVLTNPEQTQKYMFGCRTISDWQKGSSLLWSAVHEGKDTVFVKGTIKDIQANKLLVYTTIDPFSTIDDVPENYLTVTYTLMEKDGNTTFTVAQGDYSKVAEGEKRYQDAYNNGEGWNPILVQIKQIAEAE